MHAPRHAHNKQKANVDQCEGAGFSVPPHRFFTFITVKRVYDAVHVLAHITLTGFRAPHP